MPLPRGGAGLSVLRLGSRRARRGEGRPDASSILEQRPILWRARSPGYCAPQALRHGDRHGALVRRGPGPPPPERRVRRCAGDVPPPEHGAAGLPRQRGHGLALRRGPAGDDGALGGEVRGAHVRPARRHPPARGGGGPQRPAGGAERRGPHDTSRSVGARRLHRGPDHPRPLLRGARPRAPAGEAERLVAGPERLRLRGHARGAAAEVPRAGLRALREARGARRLPEARGPCTRDLHL
mmetsp:Transcript_49552/g.158555  ORF Transcript_49552/g.158555 Transcript_49552/m.158555 type:complete len:239 (+) Transcript_49552:452-1168(+)